MKICIIYHSYSGITRGLAEKVRDACGGDLVEVTPKERYSTITAYALGCLRARKEECDAINPEIIDVTSYDLIVIGTPVWAWKATPAINGAIKAMTGLEGKPAVIFATCGSQAKDTLQILKRSLESRGARVTGEIVLDRKEVGDNGKIGELISLVKAATPAG